MPGKTVKVLYSESVIAERVEAMANDISAWAPKDLMVIAILKGSFMFAADILRAGNIEVDDQRTGGVSVAGGVHPVSTI